MLGSILSHHGLCTLLLDCPQYSEYAMYCGSRNPAATATPPSPVVNRWRTVLRWKSCLRKESVRNASSSKRIPLSNPLLRKVVATPNSTPDASTNRSRLREFGPKLFAKSRNPEKVRSAHELSAKGAERKRPAGEIICKAAAV